MRTRASGQVASSTTATSLIQVLDAFTPKDSLKHKQFDGNLFFFCTSGPCRK
jgi:hypothetical protein